MGTESEDHEGDRSGPDASRLYEERLKTLLELSSEWYWEQDEHHRFTLIVGTSFGQTGVDPQEYLGKSRWDYDAVPIGDGGNWDHHKSVLDAKQPFADFVFRRIDAQGEIRYISASGRPVFDGQRFTGYRGVAKDVTASMRAEQLLRLEHMVARCLASAESASTALNAVIRSICETQSWECGRYFGRDDKADALVMNEFWHVPSVGLDRFIEQSREISYTPGSGLIGQVWQSGEPLWVTDISKDARIQKGIARQIGMHGTFIFPVVSEGKTIGVLSFHSTKVREPDERLLQAIGVIGSQIGQFLQRKQAEERIQYLATHDGLTGLPNRTMFSQLVNVAIPTARRYQRKFAVLFIDLDRFKLVNDTLGHEAGDKLLQEIATRFTGCLRESDVVARLGGDEFVVLLQEVGDAEQVATVARKILSAAIKPVLIRAQECRVTASIGICMYPEDAQDEQSLMKNADTAMYLAKEEGKNNFQFYSENIKAQSLRAAVAGNQPAPRPGAQGVLPALPGQARFQDGRDHRCRSAAALAASRPRAGVSRAIHPGCRGNGADRPHRPVGVADGLRAERRLAAGRFAALVHGGQFVGAPVRRRRSARGHRRRAGAKRDETGIAGARAHRKHGDAGPGGGGQDDRRHQTAGRAHRH